MNMVNFVITAFVAFIFVYAIVDRICKCIENKANVKALSELSAIGENLEQVISVIRRNTK